ncbi:MAG: hypothetical protein NVS1B10_06780 [Candidatus Saccharimonadales bacterium]
MFLVGQWYRISQRSKPLSLGVSFIPDYAASLGIDPKATMDSLLGIGVKHFRLVSYWSDGEPVKGKYDYSQLDWQFQKAEARHAKITLTLGLRQPRWPECHAPSFIELSKPTSNWQPALENYMTAVIDRYKNSPSLSSYQLENEFFLKGFGTCTNFDRSRLISEFNLIKSLDNTHPVIIGRSNNALGFPIGQPKPDEFSISVYKRVWDAGLTHRYLEYPFPSWFYSFLGGTQKLFLHRDMALGEMQAEAWGPNGQTLTNISLDEQNKSLNAQRLKDRFSFAKSTGMKQIDMWGSEYWYYRAYVLHDSSLVDIASQQFRSTK